MQTKNRTITINGSKYLFNFNLTLFELVNYLGFNKNVIVIDYNGTIKEKTLWKRTFLQSGYFLEVLSIAGGG
jgi:thiamine biosynthesis protein ThiS